MTHLDGLDDLLVVLPVLCLHKEAEVEGGEGCAPTLSSGRMDVDSRTLLKEVVQGFGCLEELVDVLVGVLVDEWEPDILFDSFLLVPHFELVFIHASTS